MAVGSRLRGILDELIATGYPDQVAQRIATGELPMDTASRMQRAESMGFDPSNVAYHGTRADIAEFQPSSRGKMGPGVYHLHRLLLLVVTRRPVTASHVAEYMKIAAYLMKSCSLMRAQMLCPCFCAAIGWSDLKP